MDIKQADKVKFTAYPANHHVFPPSARPSPSHRSKLRLPDKFGGESSPLAEARGAGFTLIETLFAVLIFVLISGTLYFSITVGLKTVARQRTNFEIFQELRICLREIKQDLRSFFYEEGIELEPFEGGGSSFSLISYKAGGLYKIGYYQEGNGFFRSAQKLVFTKGEEGEKAVQEAEGQSYQLAALLKKVEFEYLDENKDWQGSWDKDEEYPSAVKVTFFFEDGVNENSAYKFEDVILIPSGKKIFAAKGE